VRPYGEYVALFHASGRGNEPTCGLFKLDEMRLEIPVDCSFIYPSRESIWVVSRAIGDHQTRHAFYDLGKREFLPGWFWEALPFSCGLGAIREEEGHSYYVDANLRPVFDAKYDDVGRFSFGLAAVYKDEDAGYIDTTGRMRLILPYDRLLPFNEFGLAIANRGELEWNIDIIDREGRPRISALETADFWDGDFPYFEVSNDNEPHILDPDLNRIF
jgi:hypothetical protein